MSDTDNFSLRMPVDIGNYIREIAKQDRRPINETIVILLEYAIKEKTRKRKSKKVSLSGKKQ